jgi:predicted transposase YbfD/YdcC
LDNLGNLAPSVSISTIALREAFSPGHGGTFLAQVTIQLDEVLGSFDELEDPRSDIHRKDSFVPVIIIAMMAVLAGAGGPTAITRWANFPDRRKRLAEGLDWPEGKVPCKDVFRRVLCLVNPAAFQACCVRWLQALRAKAAAATGVEKPVLAVDGKTLRRRRDRNKDLGALHSVRVWAGEFGLSLGQVACAEKSNEITAIPERLRLVDIKGTIITIDALGTPKAIAAQIVAGQADFVLAVKGNQETPERGLLDPFDKHLDSDFADANARRHVTVEKGHGREEVRTYVQMPVPEDLPEREKWKGLQTIGMATLLCTRDGKETSEVRYYISSRPMGVKTFARAVRSHWGIENSCHWTLDMTYREDASRIRDRHVAENFAWLNRFTLPLLKQHPKKDSIAMKRRACGWSDDFLLEVLTGTDG